MVLLAAKPPDYLPEGLTCYAATEPLLEDLPVIVFLGNATRANSTGNTSRIQAHIYSLAGFRSFFRLTIAPNAPHYAAATHLPSFLQGDQTFRGLAIALLNYFSTLPLGTQSLLSELAAARQHVSKMFDEMHAGQLASRMEVIDQSASIAALLKASIPERVLSWVDIDLLLPRNTFADFQDLLAIMGSSTFLPTAKLRRAPSKSTSRIKTTEIDITPSLKHDLLEFLHTEDTYLQRLRELCHDLAPRYRLVLPKDDAAKLFPEILAEILDLHRRFFHDLRLLFPEEADLGAKDIMTFSQTLAKYMSLFKPLYQVYLRLSVSFSKIISHNADQEFLRMLQQEEQKLRSALIEPVQRLPRYSLLIDSILSHLPVDQAAVKLLLKARDVINETCALDVEDSSAHVVRFLSQNVAEWPQFFQMTGRAIAAVDVLELHIPFMANNVSQSGLLILFPGRLLLLRKTSSSSLSARGLLDALTTQHSGPPSLVYDNVYDLMSCRFSESADGRLIYLNENPTSALSPAEMMKQKPRVFELQAPYYGKAAKFGYELALSRVEVRYPEQARDPSQWDLRTIPSDGLGLVVAVTEQCPDSAGPIQMFVQGQQSPREILAQKTDVQIAICVSRPTSTLYKLEVGCFDGARSSESCSLHELMPALQKRLEEIISLLQRSDSVTRTGHQISLDAAILRSLRLPQRSRPRSRSPVKLLSHMFASDPPRRVLPEPRLEPPRILHHDKLDLALQAYIIALRSRSGNIVGKTLQNRASADELAVNELYNGLLDHPERLEMTAIVAVDVLFTAFEKFLRHAWPDPLFTPSSLPELQQLLNSGQPPLFAAGVQRFVSTLSEQNTRALSSIIKLIADLLDAAGSDSDRGALVAAFSQALFSVPHPHDYIHLLDRLVDDFDTFFPTSTPLTRKPTSNTSLRRRLGEQSPLWRSLKSNRPREDGSVSSASTILTASSTARSDSPTKTAVHPVPNDKLQPDSVTITTFPPASSSRGRPETSSRDRPDNPSVLSEPNERVHVAQVKTNQQRSDSRDRPDNPSVLSERPPSNERVHVARQVKTNQQRSEASRIEALERKLEAQESSFAVALAKTEKALQASQLKLQALNKLYLETSVENEALYDRFNDELGRVLARVKAGEGVLELQQQLAAALASNVALRKDLCLVKSHVT